MNENKLTYDNSLVRRQDRLLDEQTALNLLATGEYAFMAMVETRGEENAGYGIPVNFVVDAQEGCIYIHCAPEGHKLACIDTNPHVTIAVVGETHVISNKYTTNYSSIVVRGTAHRHLPDAERLHALELILDKYSPADKEIGMKYASKSFHRTEILRIDIESISGKQKNIAF